MGNWFTNQIKERCRLDDEIFKQANKKLEEEEARTKEHISALWKAKANESAVDALLDFYKINKEILRNIDREDILYRLVTLEGDWWKDSYQPFLAVREEGTYTALIPGAFAGYYYWDDNGRKIRLTAESALHFTKAYQFCKPMSEHPISPRVFFQYMFSFLTAVDFLFYAFLSVVTVLLGLVFPKMSHLVFLYVQEQQPEVSYLAAAFVFMILAVFCSAILQSGTGLMYKRMVQKVTGNLTNAILIRVLQLDVIERKEITSSDLWKITCDFYDFCDKFIQAVLLTGTSLLFMTAYFSQMVRYMKHYVLLGIGMFLFQIVYSLILIGRVQKHDGNRKKQLFDEENFFTSGLEGIHKIRQCHAEKRIYGQWADIFCGILREERKANTFKKKVEGVTNLTTICFSFLLVFLAVREHMQGMEFLVMNMVAALLLSRAGQLSYQMLILVNSKSYWRTMEVLLKKDFSKQKQGIRVRNFSGEVSINHVSFSYENAEKKILDDINIHVKKNEYIAIVGESGCGKSTLLNLMIGRLRPSQGSIFYGSYHLAKTNRRSLLVNMGIIMQDDVLIPGTIRENLQMNAGQADEEQMWEALRRAGIADDIRELPFGLDTLVDSRTSELSGGQIQRILVARAIVAKPKMLILDEATSALDNLSQRRIKDTLDELACTKIVVAHRLSTVKDCDRILVLKDGKLVEEGGYEELIAKKGYFAELVLRQQVDVVI